MCKSTPGKVTTLVEKSSNGSYTFKEIVITMECNFDMGGRTSE